MPRQEVFIAEIVPVIGRALRSARELEVWDGGGEDVMLEACNQVNTAHISTQATPASRLARIIFKFTTAAATHLTPMTLELGVKSPVIVHGANLGEEK
ncbi:hypothetical protein DFP72DRAFT_1162478 [Ephemerocybe angulata]|uniref:Uncharacterized protein n=1 Tax=Ephemerocybe angulata TaxID=980116 RepID=A0A8H6IJK0_9AGAR|nr:hypothetical protein DFP72DRAFT_1162478 [Tulosesus angulatus]